MPWSHAGRLAGFRRTALLLCAGVSLAFATSAQSQESTGFTVDAVDIRGAAPSPDTRVDLYTRIPYVDLAFTGTPRGFVARYEVRVEVSVLDQRGYPASVVQSPLWEQTVSEATFARTGSKDLFDYTTHSLHLPPGRYAIAFELLDKVSHATYLQEIPVEVRDLTGIPALSDIILLRDFNPETNTIFPRVTNTLGADGLAFDIYYEIYADERQSLGVTTTVFPQRVNRTLFNMGTQPHGPAAVYTATDTILVSEGRRQVISHVPLLELDVGDYMIRVEVALPAGSVLDASERAFSVQWNGLARYLLDLDRAIDQLVYCAKRREVTEIRSAPTKDEQLRLFREFWRKRDPTPRTPRNERMEEYYFRIDYANRKFGNSGDGWKTDRGQVLVLHGSPDYVNRQSFRYDADPWEVWYYYGIGRQFIFVDKTGFGDYELVVPIWDERTRIR